MIAVSLWTRQKVGCRFSDQVSSLFVFDHISKITESGLLKRQSFIFTILDLRLHLLGIESTEQLILSNHRGNLFENLVVTEIIKRYEALEKRPRLHHWRDSNRKEIDLIIEKGGKPYYLIEIKSSATFRPEAFSTIDSIALEMGVPCERRFVVYGGSDSFGNRHGRVIGFRNLGELVE